jgi:DNA-binding MarR family transcriptional regulator/N-acetylglutamate synthase-like GNAT family acetyltransferase
MIAPVSDPGRIAAVRRFGRCYTGAIGVLRERLHDSRFSLTEARVLYELANQQSPTAADIARELGLDAGYLSRILQRFVRDGLLRRDRSPHDGRQTHLTLTASGRDALAPLEAASAAEVGALLARLPDPAQAALVAAMGRIETLLQGIEMPRGAWLLRGPRPGDIGWVVARHGALYAQEYAFDARFEALVAKVAGAFLEQNDPVCERCWIAERDGVNVGSIFLVRADAETARLRLLLVEPTARGAGIGRRLVAECVDFARAAGYRRIVLWTNDILVAARQLYVQAGFQLVARKPHCDFGPPMVGEDWALVLRPEG